MATLNGIFFEYLIYSPGNPNFPVLPGSEDPNTLFNVNYQYGDFAVRGPVTPNPALYPAHAAAEPGYSQWFLNRIWITPNPLEFGNIVGDTTLTVDIFNTFEAGQTLNTINLAALGAGVSVLDDPLPLAFKFLQSRSIDIQATTQGPPLFDNAIVFEFAGSVDISVIATGKRLILLPFRPESPIIEQIIWNTSILKSRSGLEQRFSLREVPQQRMQLKYLLEDGTAESAKLRNILLSFQGFQFGLPIWWEEQITSAVTAISGTVINVNTDNTSFQVGGTIIIIFPDDITIVDGTIDSFDSTTITLTQPVIVEIPEGSSVLPLKDVYIIEEPQFSDELNALLGTTLKFETIKNTNDLANIDGIFPIYQSKVVMSDPNAVSGKKVTSGQRLDIQVLENPHGNRFQVALEAKADIGSSKGVVFQNSLLKVWQWRTLLHALRGSWTTFYLPTFRNDLPLNAATSLNSASFIIKNSGVTLYSGISPPHRDVMLTMADGTQYFQRVVSATEGVGDTEIITLAGVWSGAGTAVPVGTRISWLQLVRLQGDIVTYAHDAPGWGSLRFNVVAVQDD